MILPNLFGKLRTQGHYFVRLFQRCIPGEFAVVAEIVVGDTVWKERHHVATNSQHLRHPEFAVINIRGRVVVGPEGIVVHALVVDFCATLIRVLLHRSRQQAGMQVLLAIDFAAISNQECPDFGNVVGNPPLAVAAFSLALPAVIGGAHDGVCAWAKLNRDVDFIHHELVNIGIRAFLGLQVIVQGAGQDESVASAIDPARTRLCLMWHIEGRLDSFCIRLRAENSPILALSSSVMKPGET